MKKEKSVNVTEEVKRINTETLDLIRLWERLAKEVYPNFTPEYKKTLEQDAIIANGQEFADHMFQYIKL